MYERSHFRVVDVLGLSLAILNQLLDLGNSAGLWGHQRVVRSELIQFELIQFKLMTPLRSE